jgi:hypothetical protein
VTRRQFDKAGFAWSRLHGRKSGHANRAC